MKKTVILAFISLLSAAYSNAQHKITGRVINEATNTPLEFANVILNTADSVYVTGLTSNLEGYFELKNVPPGNYLLITSYLGFISKDIALNGFTKSIDLGDIFMQEESNLLDAVTVTGSTITNKPDKMVVFITDKHKQMSSNGLNILAGMQLPRLIVNPLMNEVSLPGGEEVLFCINGINAPHSDIRTLQPDEIIRVEYINNPGLRYGNADAVINYIIKREVSGGSVSLDLGNSVNTIFGDDIVSAKFNYKKSEFGLNYSIRYRKSDDTYKYQERTFNFSDGSSYKRYDVGIPGDYKEVFHKVGLYYNLMDDKYFFSATIRGNFDDWYGLNYSNQHNSITPDEITSVFQGGTTKKYIPSLDLYYARFLKNNQTLILNVVGTYINSDVGQQYQEEKNNQQITDIISDVDGEKYSIIGEGIYEKIFENSSRFTGGFKHTQAYTNNKYTGNVKNTTKMDQMESYLYAEYAGNINKFNYTGGIGVSRSWAKQEDEKDYTYYTFRPRITLQYDFSPTMYLRLKGEIFNTSPSLSNLSAIEQYIDTLQIRKGNPELDPYLNYLANLQYYWKKGIFSLNSTTTYQYSPKIIMEDIFRDDQNDMFVYIYNNQRSWQKLNSELMLNVGPIKDVLTLSVTGGVNRYISKGNEYTHTHTNFYGRAQIMGMYKKFMAMFQISTPYDRFVGENLEKGENTHMFMLSYNGGNFTVGAGIMNPFLGKYERIGEYKNKYTPNSIKAYINDFSRMILLKFSWNFNYGRKTKSINKRMNNSDTDPGIIMSN